MLAKCMISPSILKRLNALVGAMLVFAGEGRYFAAVIVIAIEGPGQSSTGTIRKEIYSWPTQLAQVQLDFPDFGRPVEIFSMHPECA